MFFEIFSKINIKYFVYLNNFLFSNIFPPFPDLTLAKSALYI